MNLNYYQKQILKNDLYNKFLYKNTKKIPEIKKIILNFGCLTPEIKKISASLLAIELLTNKKGQLTKATKPNAFLKVKKGSPVGCKTTLQKQQIYNFLEKNNIQIFLKTKNLRSFNLTDKINKNSFSYEIKDTFVFSELEKHYHLFQNLPKLNITITLTTTKTEELSFIIKSFQFPVTIIKSKYNSIGRV